MTRILSVDDTPANLYAVRALLEPMGHTVVDALSGAEALDLARAEEFAVVLLDVMMPGMDGMETLRRLRTISSVRHTPVILVTARDINLSEIEQAYALGAVDYISKPVPGEILRGKVNALASAYETHRALRSRDAALAVKDRQIAILAHDLRNPLSTLQAGLQVLRRSHAESTTASTLDRLDRAAERMGGMIRDLLDFARAGTGAMPILPAPMDLGVLCREVLEEFETADPERKIELTIGGDLSGEWDRARLYQSLSNLVGNATHYGRGRAKVGVRGLDEHVELVVHNGGPPIPKDLLPVIFRPFERGQDDGTGLGLGLYIVDAITRAHGGTVSVASSEASGTTFTLRVPRHSAAPAHATP